MNNKIRFRFETNKLILIAVSIILFVLLCCNYRLNCFHIVDQEWFDTWQEDSEWLVQQRMIDDDSYGFSHNYGLLGEYPSTSAPYEYNPNHAAYTGQIGLQGFLFGAIYRIFHSINFSYWVETIIFVVTAFAILYWLYKEFGLIAASGAYIILFFSRWLIVSVRNLYWVIWTLILPFVIMLFFLRHEEQKKQYRRGLILFLLFICIFLRSGCGYEFISVAMINMEVPVFYYAIKNRWKLKDTLLRLIQYGLTALGGFFTAIFVCLTQVYFYSGHSWKTAIDILFKRVAYRTGLGATGKNFGEIISNSLHASKFSVLTSYFTMGEPLLFNWRMNLIIFLIIIAVALTFILVDNIPEFGTKRTSLIGFDAMILVAFLGPLSWFVLASGHSYIHTHICYILWSLPFLILGGGLFFYAFSLLFKHLYQKYLVQATAMSLIAFFVIACLYVNNHSYTMKQIKEASTPENLIYKDDDTSIYLYQDQLYYICDKEYYDNSIYFLHYYTDDEEAKSMLTYGFVNQDFKFKNYKQHTPFWEHNKIAVRSIPNNYSIDEVETGRWNPSD